jgi:peptidoglycan/xylan/chitin deacetylase (PgdA/CDA1 family)
VPVGATLLDLSRPLVGSVPYGRPILNCTKPGIFSFKQFNLFDLRLMESGTIAIAFDDGPARNFTSKILDLFASYNMKATFFVTGHNFAKPIDDPTSGFGPVLTRMYGDGHQIGHHSWTHENMTLLNSTLMLNQISYNERALRNVLGFIPTYFRPPYLQCQEACQALMLKMGYHIIMTNLDTDGE